ncbi:MAG TPA: hypothetical protein VGL21_10700 [Jatrophihabitantaceae bacterium]
MHHLTTQVPGAHGARTVAEALAAIPSRHDAVIGAYTSGVEAALKIVAALVLVAGAPVITEMTLSARREGDRFGG